MARLIKTPAGHWKVRYYDGSRNAKGKLKEVASQTFERKADALDEQRRLELQQRLRHEKRRARPGRVLTMASLLDLWGRGVLSSGAARGAHVEDVKRILGDLSEARGWTLVTQVRSDLVAAWRSERDGRGSDKPLSMLKSVLRYGRDVLKQPVDPDVIALPGRRGVKRRPAPVLLTADQVAALIALARKKGGDHGAAIIEHLATYGCRPVDACRLSIRDFNAKAGTLTLRETKNGETVTHPLLPIHVERYAALSENRRPDDALFLSPSEERWRVDRSAGQLLDWYTANVSQWILPRPQWGLYALKDYAISTMDRRGIDDRTKALFTGHTSLEVFQRYKTTNQERAVAALGVMRPAGAADT